MKAIETHYKGYRFRSRLEARWAVFFDELGVPWEYEKEGFNLSDTRYLPDFWLPDQQCWIEIKGQHSTDQERRKAGLLTFATNHPVYIFSGEIRIPNVDEEPSRDGLDYFEKLELDGAIGYDPGYASIRGVDKSSPCYPGSCIHETDFGYDKCPYQHSIPNIGKESELVCALYTGEILSGDDFTYYLTLNPDDSLYCTKIDRVRHAIHKNQPLPQEMQNHYSGFVNLFKRFSINWSWSIGGRIAATEPIGGFRWSECSICGKYGISYEGNEWGLPCHKSHKRIPHAYLYRPCPDRDSTSNLIKAYMAARSARFEFGEKGN